MRFYNGSHAFYCGVDLHARSMFTHVLDHAGATVFARDLPARPDAFLPKNHPSAEARGLSMCLLSVANSNDYDTGTITRRSPQEERHSSRRGQITVSRPWCLQPKESASNGPVRIVLR